MMIKGLPWETNLVAHTGETFSRQYRWVPGGEPMNFSGYTAWLVLGTTIDDPLTEITTEDGSIVLTEDGFININISSERIIELSHLDIPTKKGTGTLFYNLTIQDPFGEPRMYMRGNFYIEHNVPRPK